LLEGVPAAFIFEQEQFVARLLSQAHASGRECYEAVFDVLRRLIYFRARSRTIGVPDPEDVGTRDNATLLAQKYPLGSPIRRFYETVAAGACSQIEWQRKTDEELEEE